MNDMASPLGDIREDVRKLCGGFAGEILARARPGGRIPGGVRPDAD